jgi:hypothetical protein
MAAIQARSLSTDVADEHHHAGQDAGRGNEADQGLEEEGHGASPKDRALNPEFDRSP